MSAPRRPRIVVTHWIHDDVADELRTIGDPILNETRDTLSRLEILRRCREAEALIVFMPDAVDAGFLEACPRLRIISAALKGFDNFDCCVHFESEASRVPSGE